MNEKTKETYKDPIVKVYYMLAVRCVLPLYFKPSLLKTA